MRSKYQKLRHGFTLIEILVAVGIIAILTAIIIPVTIRSKERAKMAVSINNLKQIGTATIMYAHDHDEFLPPYTNYERILLWYDPEVTTPNIPTDSPSPQRLIDSLDSYLSHEKDVWYAPTDPYARVGGGDYSINHIYTSYLYYPVVFDWHPINDGWPPIASLFQARKDAALWIEYPSRKIIGNDFYDSYYSSEIQYFVGVDGHVEIWRVKTIEQEGN